MPEAVDEVRGFNRFYTRVLGLLRPDLAGSTFGLTEARVLYELAHSNGVSASDLRAALDLDAGYLSRILGAFSTAGLIVRERSTDDGRRQTIRLTDDGRRAFAELDRLQAQAIDTLLTPLDQAQRQELVTSMRTIKRVLDAPGPRPRVIIRPPEPGDLGWVVERHGARYAAEYGWDATFEALVARVVADFAERRGTAREACWIAEVDDTRVGSVFCTAADEPDTAQLRLLLVEPQARGLGVGTRLVDECLRFAKRWGYTRITLWTNDVLVAARRIYERAGFRCDRREAHHSFGHDLVGEYWSRDLAGSVAAGLPPSPPRE
ncbi:bifunctional helix-turn-helix transcriptional regulator/GNAT family N-acetyltransferase [Mycolicibacterium moriokaense]|jgi:DNA-binding MarR family transcriptional regulator/GNAT superfamily N-acetyltransferase|uniref:GNAT family N-acetyltransferase n=1 Tax=Mycolicibacterium moriokaense TaxID=39691 RepID=A0AAD1HDQ2_9MYCO|nr:helix-turn-helix domain-containing GNAT family N-acetyltransferase [Mycolicibacterium moriokaense]MCV7038426.1 MarR family transcriptional regulator [Mycolicibacterium moriokaense]BBX02451.1 GNAT family N-acetyltransferase [Mycolicibacterium moriokaense]